MKKLMAMTAVVGVISSVPVFAKSGNGGGYNGPTLSGDAVVMSADKVIKFEELKSSLGECFFNDKKTGFFQEISKSSKKFEEQLANVTTANSSVSFYSNKISSYRVTSYPFGFEFQMESGAPNGIISVGATLFTANGLPRLLGDIENFYEYDEVTGDILKDYFVVKNLKIVRANTDEFITLINFSTKRETQILAPVGDLTNCIIDRVGKL